MVVGIAIALVSQFWIPFVWINPFWLLSFAVLTTFVLGAMGFLAGLWANKYDKLAAFQNFVILPLTFLSGVFYSVSSLPPFWQQATWLNPFFYMVDGFRYGFLGVADVSPWLSLGVTLAFAIVISVLCLWLLSIGWKIRR
jgi:ABC-2 type transport system permease protein